MHEGLRWERVIPTKPGIYLRVNAGHQISRHLITKEGRYLKINWGWGGEVGTLSSKDKQKWEYKLGLWLWYGPIPRPPVDK